MRNCDVLRSLRYTLDASDAAMVELFALGGVTVDKPTVLAWLKREEDPGYLPCPDATAIALFDGLIVKKRGPSTHKPETGRLTNNLVLKKLRVAFQLRDDDMHAILRLGDLPLSKPELSALFRSEDHQNYREAGDQVLRHFLRGLALRERGRV
jgi:uncharacterized protein YehS (DUF1456 family)